MANTVSERRTALRELAWLFLRLGVTAFGGPAVHIAMMEDEVVRRRHWLTREQFLDLLGATNLIPGPNSTEMAIHIGHRRVGWLGLVVAGICFVVPAAAITLALAWAYVEYGTRPQAGAFLYGVKPVIIAVILQALWSLARTALKTRALAALMITAVAASAAGLNEMVVLLAAGATAAVAGRMRRPLPCTWIASSGSVTQLVATAAGGSVLTVPFGLAPLFLFFLKVGAILFGSGYVLLAFLKADLVDQWGWLTNDQLLDAVAIGQITPGPVLSTATFIGYVLGGIPGAALATVGIFLPSFVYVSLSAPLIPRLRQSPTAAAFLDGVNAGALALMAVVTITLGRAAIVDVTSAALALGSAVLLLRYRINSAWLILGGAGVGFAVSRGLW